MVDANGMEDFEPVNEGRSVSAQRDIVGNIITTGDNSPVFVGDYERLKEAYIDPQSVFERVVLDRFTGRGWLVDAVDSFLQQYDRGYLIIEAPAGSGKTTFTCHLVRQRGYVHHFVELAPDSDGIVAGLRSLAAQLISKWRLKPQLLEEVLPGAASRPYYLQSLLFQIAERRNELNPEEKIVVAVDGVDEAGLLAGMNVMGLPKVLPKGTYFIVTQRPVRVALYVDSPKRVYSFEVEDEQNLSDMRVYLQAAATREPVSSLLKSGSYTAEQFVEYLLSKCGGVWIYLHYVISEIERGERSPLNLDTLPQGIWQYYAQFWQRVRDANSFEWDTSYLPILSTMAAAQEDISFELLCKLSGLEEKESLRRTLRETWRPFIAGATGKEKKYRLYHASLREFFDGRANKETLTAQEQALSFELAEATKRAHGRMADYYLTEWGGLDVGLPNLGGANSQSGDGIYGMRHVVTHLEKCGRADKVHKLLRLERRGQNHSLSESSSIAIALRERWLTDDRNIETRIPPRPINVWYEAREKEVDVSGYLSDLTRAWRLAVESESAAGESIETIPCLGMELRYALMTSSINSLAGTIPPELITASVEKGVWHLSQALTLSRQIPDVRRRAEAITGLIPLLPAQRRSEVLAEAISTVRLIPYRDDRYVDDEDTRLRLFVTLAELHAARERASIIHEGLEYAQKVQNEEVRARLFKNLIRYLPGEIVEEFFSATKEFSDDVTRVDVLSNLIQILPPPTLNEVRALARDVEDLYLRSMLLNKMSQHIGVEDKSEVIAEALRAARIIEDGEKKVKVLGRLLPHLEAATKHEVVDELIAAAISLQDEHRPWVISELPHILSGHTSEEKLKKVTEEALIAANDIKYLIDQVTQLERLIPFMPAERKNELHEQVMHLARTTPYERPREGLLQAIYYHAPEDKKHEVLREALELTFANPDNRERDRSLAYILPSLNDSLLDQVMSLYERSLDLDSRTGGVETSLPSALTEKNIGEALIVALEREFFGSSSISFSKLLSHVPTLIRQRVLQQALIKALSMFNADQRRRALKSITPHLSNATIREALKGVQTVGDEEEIGSALTMLPHFVSEDVKDEIVEDAIEQARALRFAERSLDLLLQTSSHVGTDRKRSILTEAISLAHSIKDDDKRSGALARLVTVLPPDMKEGIVEETLVAVRRRKDDRARLSNLNTLIPHLSGDDRESAVREALSLSRNVSGEEQRIGALRSLLPNLPPILQDSVLNEALESARAVAGNGKKARAISMLLSHLTGEAKAAALRDATDAALGAEDCEDRSWALRALVSHMPEVTLVKAIGAAKAIEQPRPRAELLMALLRHVQEPHQSEIHAEVIKASHEAHDESDKTIILMSLINESRDAQSIMPLLLDIQALQNPHNRAYVLSVFIPKAPPASRVSLINEAIEAIKEIYDESDRAHTLLFLVPGLVEQLKAAGAPDMSNESPEDLRKSLLNEVASLFQDNLPTLARRTRYEMLREMHFIAPAVSALGGQGAIIETARAVRDVGHWWP